jgi:hypothetical protein
MNLVPVAIPDTASVEEMLDGIQTEEQREDEAWANEDHFTKGVLSPQFGNRSKRRAQLVARLKRRRRYGPPVRGGTGKHSSNMPSKKKKFHF